MQTNFSKFMKYKEKNLRLERGGSLFSKALSAVKKVDVKKVTDVAKKGTDAAKKVDVKKIAEVTKKGIDTAAKISNETKAIALKNLQLLKKELEDNSMKELLGEADYKTLHENLDSLILILNLKSMNDVYLKKEELKKIINNVNKIIQSSKINENTKIKINTTFEIFNAIVA